MSRPARLNLSTTAILVAGGAPFEVDVLLQILSGFGAGKLRRAETADDAISSLLRDAIDFVLLDHRIGDDSALEVVRQLRRLHSDVRQAPVLIATAFSHPSVVTQARDAGADFIVTKPLTPKVLFERMSWLAGSHRGFVESDGYVGPDRRVQAFGPPAGTAGRRKGDLPPDVGHATEPNMSQDDIDALFPTPRGGRA